MGATGSKKKLGMSSNKVSLINVTRSTVLQMGSSATRRPASEYSQPNKRRNLVNEFDSFRPETLACRPNQDSSTCLTLGQIDTIKKAYKPLYGSKSDDPSTLDTEIYDGYLPGVRIKSPQRRRI